MKKLICEVDEDYFNELCEAFKKYPMGGIPTYRAWALLEGLKNGTPFDGLTNGEVMQMLLPNTELHWTNECEYGLRPQKAIDISVIEKIHDAIDNAEPDIYIENPLFDDSGLTKEHIHEIIDKAVKEYTHENT